MKISVVILHYQAEAFLRLCLESLIRATKNTETEIIVADNASPAFDTEVWKNKFPEVKFMRFGTNKGFAFGNNKAVELASGEYIFLLNPDTVVPEDLFDKLLLFSKQNPGHGILGAKLIDGSGRFLPESKRNLPGLLSSAMHLTGLNRFFNFQAFNSYYNNHLKENETGKNDVFVGAFMFFKKEDFLHIGGFDENFFMYGEDIDLSKRFKEYGRQGYYLGHLPVIHFKGESTPKNDFYRKIFIQSTHLYYRKHHPKTARAVSPLIEVAFVFNRLKTAFSFHKKSPDNTSSPVYFVGKNVQSFDGRFFPGRKIIPADMTTHFEPGSLLIWDTGSLTFKDIIRFMESNVSLDFQYRFYLPGEKLLLGSDSPDMAGEIRNYTGR